MTVNDPSFCIAYAGIGLMVGFAYSVNNRLARPKVTELAPVPVMLMWPLVLLAFCLGALGKVLWKVWDRSVRYVVYRIEYLDRVERELGAK